LRQLDDRLSCLFGVTRLLAVVVPLKSCGSSNRRIVFRMTFAKFGGTAREAVACTVVGNPGLENPSILAYASTKGAIETLVKHWAAILGPSGIRGNAVAPGVIDTDMSNFTKTEAGRDVTLGMQALKRIGKPEDVADVVAFVVSDGARWITGASIPVDGGSKL
jgi:NAD(P)-dependent dehydrogenase (short-subunit alcohol dehydrogenase family)